MKKILLFCAILTTSITFTNCTNDNGDDNGDEDNSSSPIIAIQSPNFIGPPFFVDNNGTGPDTVLLVAEATDEDGIASIGVQVTNSSGGILVEYIEENESETEIITSLSISREFETTVPGTYSAIFTALDTNGNPITLSPRIFTFQ